MCKPNFFCADFPANPLMNVAAAADSNEFLLLDNNPATKPDKTSPVPPTVTHMERLLTVFDK